MMGLRELQDAFQARILLHEAGIEAELTRSQHADFAARLDAYVGGYRARLLEALATTYPALQATLGEVQFARQMRLYIDSTPSQHWSVRYYGADVAERLPELDAGNGLQLMELARWEWLLADVFDAADDAALRACALGAVSPAAWPGLTFRLRASVRRFDAQTPVVDLWRAARGMPPGAPGSGQAGGWLLWRRGVKSLFRSLDPTEARLLDALRAGATFGALCEQLAGQLAAADAAARAAALLRGWIEEELIADYACPDRVE